MADEWDLYAVVRSCTAATINTNHHQEEEHFSNVSSMTFQNDDNPFLSPRQGLDEIYNPYQINPITPFLGGFENIKQQQERELKNSGAAASFTFSPTNSETIRSRRRKNQQMKIVSQMTQEELSSDSWAWRKYGQKPIKGSPYPRNYYRCSTSKGCAARKQVERSPTDPTIFVVSYTGEHTHPRPTHRSSLAGTTRTKYNKNSSGDGDCSIAAAKPSCSSSPPASASSFSPTNPLKEAMDVEMVELVQEEGDDDDDILIPNTVMTEEIFKGFEELVGGKGWSTTNNGFDSNG